MGDSQRFGENFRKWSKGGKSPEMCEVCGEKMEMDPESGEGHCPVCEEPEQ